MIFGLLFAFGFLHREFTLFAVIAIVLLEVWTGELFSRRRASHWLVVVLVFLGSRQAVTLLRHIASMFGPDVPPPRLEDGITNVDLVARSVCLSAGPMLGNLWWLIAHNVPTFFGVQSQPPGALILSHQATGAPWAAWPAIVAMACALLVVASRAWRSLPPLRAPADSRVLLPAMLCVAGFLSLVGVATGCNIRNLFTIRYHLLLAFAPVGLTALAFALNDQRSHDPGPSASGARAQAGTRVVLPLMTAAVLVWATAMLGEHVRLLREYRTSPGQRVSRACRRPGRARRQVRLGLVLGVVSRRLPVTGTRTTLADVRDSHCRLHAAGAARRQHGRRRRIGAMQQRRVGPAGRGVVGL